MGKLEFIPGNIPGIPCAAAVKSDTHVYIPGTAVFLDEDANPIRDVREQTKRCLEQVERTLKRWSLDRRNIVMVTVFVCGQENFSGMNEAYAKFFGDRYPARTACVTALGHPDMLVELSCTACFEEEHSN